MDLGQVEKKLREAEFFLSKMVDQEKRAFGDKEPFDFYLSAFLNAARVIDYRLRHMHGETYGPWYTKWKKTLTRDQRKLIKFLVTDRNLEVHAKGSRRSVAQEAIKVGHSYSDRSGTLEVFAPPRVLVGDPTPPAIIYKPTYNFTIAGVERRAVDACSEYLRLLTRMLSEFKVAGTASSSQPNAWRRVFEYLKAICLGEEP